MWKEERTILDYGHRFRRDLHNFRFREVANMVSKMSDILIGNIKIRVAGGKKEIKTEDEYSRSLT